MLNAILAKNEGDHTAKFFITTFRAKRRWLSASIRKFCSDAGTAFRQSKLAAAADVAIVAGDIAPITIIAENAFAPTDLS